MKIHPLFMVLLLGVAALALSEDVNSDKYSGYAYDLQTNELIYTEVHTENYVNGNHVQTTTDFFGTDNHEKIATRTLDFSRSKISPDFETKDLRTGYLEGAEQLNPNRFRLYTKAKAGARVQEKTLHIPSPVVVDGGFNQFIKQNWNAIIKGEEVVFHFAVPSRLDYYTFRAIKTQGSADEVTIQIAPDSRIISWLVDPIVIDYSRDTKRITEYLGRSNISDGHGENYIAKLIYPKKGP